MNSKYSSTLKCAYLGYVTQAIGINLAPLLFSLFAERYGLNVSKLTFLITLCFASQMGIDAFGGVIINKLGYRNCAVFAHAFSFLGLVFLATLPEVFSPYPALVFAISVLAVGSGLTEIIISPLVNALPLENKQSSMSLLHSFYCWGHLAVIVITTLLLKILPQDAWMVLPFIWSTIPAVNAIAFKKVPIAEQTEEKSSYKNFIKSNFFIPFMLCMICAGSVEQVVAQWGSFFTETELGFSKTVGDLVGICGFALLMALSRTFYGIKGEKINLSKFISVSCIGLVLGLLLIKFSCVKELSLLGLALCGLCTGILWPGLLSLADKKTVNGGPAMFSLMALGGDVGCLLGPTLVGFLSENLNFKTGIFISSLYPALLFIFVLYISLKKHD